MTFGVFRWMVLVGILATVGLGSLSAAGGVPAFARDLPFPSNQGTVERIVEFRDLGVDLVVIRGGLRDGFQIGVLTEVRREGRAIADLIVTDAFLNFSFALVTRINRGQELQPGDSVRLQSISS